MARIFRAIIFAIIIDLFHIHFTYPRAIMMEAYVGAIYELPRNMNFASEIWTSSYFAAYPRNMNYYHLFDHSPIPISSTYNLQQLQ